MAQTAPRGHGAILVLCIDRDDDVGRKSGLSTPIVGREAVLDAAVRLALADPEESDANAMFEAVRVSELLEKEGSPHKVAVVSGVPNGGVESDRKIVSEIGSVVSGFKPTETILVTDGFGDEDIIPVVRSNLPLASVRRVVVKHSKTVEESYIVLARYLRMLWTDPRFKKWSLGLPGVTLLLFILTSQYVGLLQALMVFVAVMGFVSVVKGFDLDRHLATKVKGLLTSTLPTPIFVVEVFSTLSAITLTLVGVYVGTIKVAGLHPQEFTSPAAFLAKWSLLVGEWVKEVVDAAAVGVVLLFVGRLIPALHQRSSDAWRSFMGIVLVVALYPVALSVAEVLISVQVGLGELFKASVQGLGILLAATVAVYLARKFIPRRGGKAAALHEALEEQETG